MKCNQTTTTTAQIGIVFALFSLISGCKNLVTSQQSGTKDVDAVVSRGTVIDDVSFRPVRIDGQLKIKMELLRVSKRDQSIAEVKTYCVSPEILKASLKDRDLKNADAIMDAILLPGVKDMTEIFPELDLAFRLLVKTNDAKVCDPKNPPFYPSDKTALPRNRNHLRGRDNAVSYTLSVDGNFYRQLGNLKCMITNRVEDFKIATNREDRSFVYYIRDGALWSASFKEPEGENCPESIRQVATEDIRKDGSTYQFFIPLTDATDVTFAVINKNGAFEAYKNSQVLNTSETGIKAAEMLPCTGQNGKSFSSYVALLLKDGGSVIKYKAQLQEGMKSSKERFVTDKQIYGSLDALKLKYHVCE